MTLNDLYDMSSSGKPYTLFMDLHTSDELLRNALAFNGDSWVNEESGNISLGDDFKKYLEIASKLPKSDDEYDELSGLGEIIFDIKFLNASVDDLSYDYMVMWRNALGEPAYVGFPTNSNSGSAIRPSGTFMICSDRASAPGCWEFVRTFLATEYQDSLTNGIPVVKSSFERWKTDISYDGIDENMYYIYVDGVEQLVPLISPDKAEELSENIISCRKYYFMNPAIEEIIIRNSHDYFDGKISADEAAFNAEKEVEEYLKG